MVLAVSVPGEAAELWPPDISC